MQKKVDKDKSYFLHVFVRVSREATVSLFESCNPMFWLQELEKALGRLTECFWLDVKTI